MINLRNFLLTAAVLSILPGATARASSLSVIFDPLTLVALPGDSVIVRGTVTNLEPVAVDLNGCSVFLPGQFTTDSCLIFYDLSVGAPLSLAVGESQTFDLFTYTVNVPYTDPFGLQPPGATFTIQGALEPPYDGTTLNNLVEAPFQLEVAPEPGTAALLSLSIPLVLALRRRRKRA